MRTINQQSTDYFLGFSEFDKKLKPQVTEPIQESSIDSSIISSPVRRKALQNPLQDKFAIPFQHIGPDVKNSNEKLESYLRQKLDVLKQVHTQSPAGNDFLAQTCFKRGGWKHKRKQC